LIEIEKPKIECVESADDNTFGKFVVEPLERGYGITLGNSLRRILLSSLPGVAVTSIKIDSVLHEFSTIPGVIEDLTEIILNIKNLSFKLYSDGPKIIYIDADGEGPVTAGDIKADSDVEILNPDLHICTLNGDSRLYMELVLNKSRGYVPAEKNKQPGQPIGIIPIDSIYTPVRKVNYTVENTRSVSSSVPQEVAILQSCFTIPSREIRRKSNRWQRDRIVAGSLWGSVVANMNITCSGGSSRVLSNALKAPVESMWTSSMI
jgi:DNA-directed RNA polymerase subunit alpha